MRYIVKKIKIYRDLTSDTIAPSTMHEEHQRERIAEFLAGSEDDIITNLRKLNGKKGTKFEEFWNEVDILFSEYEASVHERRHAYLATFC